MKPNITSVLVHLPESTNFGKHDLNTCSFLLRRRLDPVRKLDRELDSKAIADIFIELKKLEKEKLIEKKAIYKKVTVLYHICIPYQRDCVSACINFLLQKHGTFVETPEREPVKPFKVEEGHYYHKVMKKTGYFKQSLADICREKGIENYQLYIVDNYLEEFHKFVKDNCKVLPRYYKPRYEDYSHLAYNNVADDF